MHHVSYFRRQRGPITLPGRPSVELTATAKCSAGTAGSSERGDREDTEHRTGGQTECLRDDYSRPQENLPLRPMSDTCQIHSSRFVQLCRSATESRNGRGATNRLTVARLSHESAAQGRSSRLVDQLVKSRCTAYTFFHSSDRWGDQLALQNTTLQGHRANDGTAR